MHQILVEGLTLTLFPWNLDKQIYDSRMEEQTDLNYSESEGIKTYAQDDISSVKRARVQRNSRLWSSKWKKDVNELNESQRITVNKAEKMIASHLSVARRDALKCRIACCSHEQLGEWILSIASLGEDQYSQVLSTFANACPVSVPSNAPVPTDEELLSILGLPVSFSN